MVAMTPHFSLIIPVYNVAAYLPHCLDSVARLTPGPDEIIVVDDGSTDACPDILRQYAVHLPQMRVIRQDNQGLSGARNTGLEHARGKWISFLDSDDMVYPDAYSPALAAAEQDDLDMVLFNGTYHFEGRRPDYPIYQGRMNSQVTSGRAWLHERLARNDLLHMVWLHLYRREFIERHGLRFVPKIIHEDVVWTVSALLRAKRIRYFDHPAIRYRIPIRQFPPAVLQNRLEAIVASSVFNARALSELAAAENDARLRELLGTHLVDGAMSIFHKLEKMPNRTVARQWLARLWNEGVLRMLWRHAHGFAQRRRVLRRWMQAGFTALLWR